MVRVRVRTKAPPDPGTRIERVRNVEQVRVHTFVGAIMLEVLDDGGLLFRATDLDGSIRTHLVQRTDAMEIARQILAKGKVDLRKRRPRNATVRPHPCSYCQTPLERCVALGKSGRCCGGCNHP